MKKLTNYFSHDSNARNDEKILAVRIKYGAEGYGIYFMILERLREEANYSCVKDYSLLAFDLRIDASKLKGIVEDFGLFAFTEDGKCFYSESFNHRMMLKDDKSTKARESVLKRWEKKRTNEESDTNVLRPNTKTDTSKESKESKVISMGDKSPSSTSFKIWDDKKFIEDIRIHGEDYPKDLLNTFFKYWSEKGASGKMKFQMEKTWETSKRLSNWQRNEEKWAK